MIGSDDQQQSHAERSSGFACDAAGCPNCASYRRHHAGKQHCVRSADPVEQRYHGEAGCSASRQVRAIDSGDVPAFTREYEREQEASEKERDGGREVERCEFAEVSPGEFQRDGDVQHDFQHDENGHRIDRAK